ncbi:hypothetical protein CNYM01_13000 [Colletotrichum nymphaeae SA-01]|uniref:Uncharacterized protein n=1 Tax=Colletotrichum nymphaeae SA-01 TaxID=1460502 RepID=A0A135S9W8_9PEZI|nr:hypothetical protein CNYM01_13000 [Colletotrichum nymphaeae SA-01]
MGEVLGKLGVWLGLRIRGSGSSARVLCNLLLIKREWSLYSVYLLAVFIPLGPLRLCVVRGREDTYGRRSFLDGSFAHENGSQSRFLASAPQSLSCMTDLRRSLLCGVRLAKASSDAPLSLYALYLSIWTAAHADAGFVTVGRRISPAYWYGWFVAAFGSVML